MKHGKIGFEWLESQITIHNLLIKAQQVDEELEQASIQLMDDSYSNEDAEEPTRIYIIRGMTENKGRSKMHDVNVYSTQVEVLIMTSKYDVRDAVKVLNSLARCVDAYINVSNIGAYCHLDRIVPLYKNDGLLHEYRLVYLCTEIQELENYPKLCKNLELFVKLTASIRGENEIQRNYIKKIKETSQEKADEFDDVPFGGGK